MLVMPFKVIPPLIHILPLLLIRRLKGPLKAAFPFMFWSVVPILVILQLSLNTPPFMVMLLHVALTLPLNVTLVKVVAVPKQFTFPLSTVPAVKIAVPLITMLLLFKSIAPDVSVKLPNGIPLYTGVKLEDTIVTLLPEIGMPVGVQLLLLFQWPRR